MSLFESGPKRSRCAWQCGSWPPGNAMNPSLEACGATSLSPSIPEGHEPHCHASALPQPMRAEPQRVSEPLCFLNGGGIRIQPSSETQRHSHGIGAWSGNGTRLSDAFGGLSLKAVGYRCRHWRGGSTDGFPGCWATGMSPRKPPGRGARRSREAVCRSTTHTASAAPVTIRVDRSDASCRASVALARQPGADSAAGGDEVWKPAPSI